MQRCIRHRDDKIHNKQTHIFTKCEKKINKKNQNNIVCKPKVNERNLHTNRSQNTMTNKTKVTAETIQHLHCFFFFFIYFKLVERFHTYSCIKRNIHIYELNDDIMRNNNEIYVYIYICLR